MDAADECHLCRVVRGEVPCAKIHEDDETIAVRSIKLSAPIDFIIAPKVHYATIGEMIMSNIILLAKISLLAPRLVSELGGNSSVEGGFRVVESNGSDCCHEVNHFHYHIVAGHNPWEKRNKSVRGVTLLPAIDGIVSKGSVWGSFGHGKLAASGAPGNSGVQRWKDAGATVVVTLQREDELPMVVGGNAIEQKCVELGMKWLHFPLNGKNALSEPSVEDKQSISSIRVVADLINNGENVVVHCSAGMHRTGFVCYMTMRLLGLSADEALNKLEYMRPVTHAEVIKCKSGRKSLQQQADELLLSLLA